MSALAKLLVAKGQEVSGSDLRGGATLEGLADLGVEVHTGHVPDVATRADLVVASSAVPEYDEEIVAAKEAGITVWRRPQLLDAITETVTTIGATGTHGKTTTTAMLVAALRATGEDPSFVVGGELTELGTNGHVGETPLLVLEADESLTIRCGQGSITIKESGKILIRGLDVVSHAKRCNRVRGGSIRLN